ncbi:FAD/NAD(P)-binding domain-containing protein [Myriangium duriaei CBS 260.36]|uniref:FAD/NAD(P)-binding domain-containing protein n=1 Tax=Myriangium duriaei CBS 260.36 TaxID=1168546 RepID=A0A9P4MLG4_9PEZI|nr:FAD/NAD(P)-binding domain-containing protein [Myriangium duriaei CBS 260.36]
MHRLQPSFDLHDEPIENFRPIKVIVIGAGYSGVYCGIRIPEKIRNCELVIYEKNAGVGGAWYENRYPGCACDVPSHSYQYSFNPNPNWSSLYAPAAEIRKYIEETARKFCVDRFVKLQHSVEDCRYDQQEGKWHVKIRRPNGEIFEDTSDVLISARGNLNHIAWPEIDGLKSFQGELMHSAAWNESYDFTNKRVGIIGSGSSAIQIIPNLRKTAGIHLDCFIRGRTWISPPFAQNIQDELGMTSFNFTEEQRKRFREDPEHFLDFRRKIETDGNAAHPVTIRGTDMQKGATAHFEESMKQRLAKKPEIFDMIKPSFAPGCRRLTPGPGFLEALVEDNVSYINTSIQRIDPKGIVTSDGRLYEIDVLVCATGFHTSSAPPFPVTGLSSLPLAKHWSTRASTYLSLATDSFPNMFIMLGPNAAIGSGSLTLMIEHTGDYIVRCIRKLQKENIKSMAIKPARVRDFTSYCDAYFPTTVFSDQCRSWYRTGDKITGLWPGSTLHCIEALRSPRWEDYEYEYQPGAENQLSFLGNGWSSLQLDKGADMAFYLRREFQDMPREGRPEENETYTTRPFSH